MRSKSILVFVIAIIALTFAGTQIGASPESTRLPILRKPDFSGLTAYQVTRVGDDATFVVSHKNRRIPVRLAGVNPPIKVLTVEHYNVSYRFTKNLLKGEKIYLIDSLKK